MRILLPGGSGQVGSLLARHLHTHGHRVTVLSRSPEAQAHQPWRTLGWNGKTPGPWVDELHTADAVIHLSGRSVNCRYTPENRRAIYDSRTEPTLLLGRLIADSPTPPKLWLNASTSTFYRHALDRPNDEFTGELGDRPHERGTRESATLPETWSFSIDVAARWEEALAAMPTPQTRKIRLRSSMVMSPDEGGVFSVMSKLARLGLGGSQGSGKQFVSWIHGEDLCRAVDLLLEHPEITDETEGVVNLSAPGPLPNRDFFRTLRRAWGQPIGLPAPVPALALGAVFMQTETELVLKSRWVLPTLLRKHGFTFRYATWAEAAPALVAAMQLRARTPESLHL